MNGDDSPGNYDSFLGGAGMAAYFGGKVCPWEVQIQYICLFCLACAMYVGLGVCFDVWLCSFACLYGTLAFAGEIRSKFLTDCGVQLLQLKRWARRTRWCAWYCTGTLPWPSKWPIFRTHNKNCITRCPQYKLMYKITMLFRFCTCLAILASCPI